MKHIAIIGNGVAGVTAARYIRKMSDHKITIISAESEHFWSRTALMYIYMGHMRYEDTKPYEDYFWKKNRIDLVHDYVKSVNAQSKTLDLKDGGTMQFDVLIIACGSKFNKWGWPGQDLEGVSGMYSLQDLELIEKYTKGISRGIVVGGGLIGIELGEMMRSRDIPVTFLVRESSYWNNVLPKEESEMVGRHIKEHHCDLMLGSELKEILPDANGRVRAVVTKAGEEIKCEFVGLTAGVRPNTGFLEDSGIKMQRGILVNEYFETNVPDIYAIGDCAQFDPVIPGRAPLEQIWYTGKMHGETVAVTICKNRRAYTPRTFYNSAKFFDIEYQTYGHMPATWGEDVKSLYWEHSDGKKAIRVNYHATENYLIGINTMGIRYRHLVCEKWLDNKTHVEEVLVNLEEANFDPEFTKYHEADLVALYNRQNPGANLVLKKKSLFGWIFGK